MAIGISANIAGTHVCAGYVSSRDREVESASRDQQCVQDLASNLPTVSAVPQRQDPNSGPLEQLLDTPSPLDRFGR